MTTEIPFDGIITLLVFLVGIPALVLQFMAADVRRVTMKKIMIPNEVLKWGALALLVVIVAILLADLNDYFRIYEKLVWSIMFLVLFIIVMVTTIQVQYRYGWREVVIRTLKDGAIKKLSHNGGYLNKKHLSDLIEIGKQSEAGPDREVVLLALQELTIKTCLHKEYHGDALETLIDGLVKMLATRPVAEDVQNYQVAVSILTTILSAEKADRQCTLIDQQHAVRALSALGETFLADINLSVGTDPILMDYEEALGLAVSHHPEMLTDVTQSLLEVGAVALDHGHYLFAVAAFQRLLTIVEDTPSSSDEARADLYGLTAHFWSSGMSSREFIQRRLARIEACADCRFSVALAKARLHSQMTMRFDTADKLSQMARDLGLERKPRNKR